MNKIDSDLRNRQVTTDLCYFLVCFRSQEYVAYLLASLYRKNDIFIIHCDLKAPISLKNYLKSISKSHTNIIVLESQPYSWAGFSHVELCLKATALALADSRPWSHLIFLSEQHLPLKSPDEIAARLAGRKSIVAIRPTTSMGGNERSDIENRFSGRYRELPGVGCFVTGLTPRSTEFYGGIYHGSNWMILCREHCVVIDCANRERRFDPFKMVVHAEETAIPSILRDYLSDFELRDSVLVATPDMTDNHDLVMTEELFRSHISSDYLFIRKRSNVITEFIDEFINRNSFSNELYHHKSIDVEEISDSGTAFSDAVANFCRYLTRGFKETLSIHIIDKAAYGSVPTFYAVIRHPSMAPEISVRVISEDVKNFKILILEDIVSSSGFSNPIERNGYIESTVRSRTFDVFGKKEFLPINTGSDGFVSISDERSIRAVSFVAVEFVEHAIAISKSTKVKSFATKIPRSNGDTMRAQRLNALAKIRDAKRYLEVGVCNGDTFFEIDVAYKVAVDPNFLFNYEEKANINTVFRPLKSDDFFETSNEAPFDLIYLDGLHTYEQTTRDFINSLRFAHDDTLWVLDDTVPHDVFSALPDQQKCYELRHKLVGGDWFWMGDVYKTVFFIERMFPFFQFNTYSGHGQTVFWKTKHPRDLSIQKVGLERIGTMGYEDLIENLEVMRVVDEHAIINAIRKP